ERRARRILLPLCREPLLVTARRVDREDGPLGISLEEILAHLCVVLLLIRSIVRRSDEGMQTEIVPRVCDRLVDESDEVEEGDVRRVIRSRPHVLERDERARTFVSHEEFSEIGVERSCKVTMTVEAVLLAIRELEAVPSGENHRTPSEPIGDRSRARPLAGGLHEPARGS